MSELVKTEGLGYSVPPGDVEAMAEGIEKLLAELDNSHFSTAFDRVRERFTWDRIIQPLKDFCENPVLAPDKGEYLTEAERIGAIKTPS